MTGTRSHTTHHPATAATTASAPAATTHHPATSPTASVATPGRGPGNRDAATVAPTTAVIARLHLPPQPRPRPLVSSGGPMALCQLDRAGSRFGGVL
jgi:hypothetical protein